TVPEPVRPEREEAPRVFSLELATPWEAESLDRIGLVEEGQIEGPAPEAAPLLEESLLGSAPAAESAAEPEVEALRAEAGAAAAERPEELDELEPLEELEAAEDEELAAPGERGSAGARALALASIDDEDIPVIPESSGLELVDGTDISDIIGFIDMEDPARSEEFGFLEPAGDSESSIVLRYGSTQVEESPELILDGALEELDLEEEAAEELELELELELSPLDLSALALWGREEPGLGAGAAVFAQEAAIPAEQGPEPAEPADTGWRFTRSAEQAASPEADDSAVQGGEIAMLSDEMRELLEYLPAAESEDGVPVDLTEYLGPCRPYVRMAALGRDELSAAEELPVVGEGSAWSEAEFLGELSSEPESDEEDGLQDPAGPGPIVYRDGVFQIDPEYPGSPPAQDKGLRELVDSVLG
ncbi:MAG TPA: hypothetical protein PLB91_08215, partial [Spirochaetales bacterium]|nr:hypothetical protein [Spirochaetales bacterium]